MFFIKALFQNDDKDNEVESKRGLDDDGNVMDLFNTVKSRTQLQRCKYPGGVSSSFPDTFQTGHLLFYERFKAYQDYMLGNYRLI